LIIIENEIKEVIYLADYGEKLCEAIGIVTNGLLNDLKFDRTVLCTVVDATKANKGEYIVSNGSSQFTAYGSSEYKLN
jgi:hypothetical protein